MKKNHPAGKIFFKVLEEYIIAEEFPISNCKNLKTQEATYHLFESSGTGIDIPISLKDFLIVLIAVMNTF